MILKITLKNTELLGIYMNLTNEYLLIPDKNNIREKIIFKNIYRKTFNIINTTIGGSSLIGCLTIGNKNGLLISNLLTRKEFLYIKKNISRNINIIPLQLSLNNPSVILSVNDNILLTNINHKKSTIQIFNSMLKTKCLILNNLNFTINKFNFPMNNFYAITSNINEKILQILSNLIQIPIFCIKCYDINKFIGGNLVLNDTVIILGKTVKLNWFENIKYIL
ncbi:translation initiation factor eIF6 (nucleomorph) [Lotharella oceanica]|uniref:Translation initiation factor eIF6 n=1 Tax=Lotharella oceanica TaxID=641309 RepID=A0A060DBC7_9EUKA|nr:translation initiation factor eIF6 [Lotharella oceanica]